MTEIQTSSAPTGTGPSAPTVIAAVIVFFFGAIWTLVAIGLIVLLSTALFAGHSHWDTFGASIALVFAPLLLLLLLVFAVVGTLFLWMGVRILRRGNGARWTAIIVFGFFALSSLGGSSASRASYTASGRIGGAIFFALVPVLLLLPPTIADFRAAKARRQTAHMMPPPAAGAPPPP
jgi:hypothetical protein